MYNFTFFGYVDFVVYFSILKLTCSNDFSMGTC